MKKRCLSLLLAVAMVMATGQTAFATSCEPESSEIPAGYVLLDSETSLVDDGDGNLVEVTVEEYGLPKDFYSESGIMPFANVGEKKVYVFKISNDSLGLGSLVTGAPITDSVKKAIANVVAKKLSEKLAGFIVPGINVVSWVLGAISWANARIGNEGFKITVTCEYVSFYSNKEGVYCYGWEPKSCAFGVY